VYGGKETKSRTQAQFRDWADRPGGPFLPEHRGGRVACETAITQS